MSNFVMKRLSMPISSLLVYGAPGTGKSTLLRNLENLNEAGPSGRENPAYYVVVHEPTDEPSVRNAIRQVYEEPDCDEGLDSDGGEQSSKILRVQALIASRRLTRWRRYNERILPASLAAAHSEGFERIVVVFDGSPLTDAFIYIGGRASLGQVSECDAEHSIASLYPTKPPVRTDSSLLEQPDTTLLLRLDDDSGEKYRERVVARGDSLDCDVSSETFAAFASGARKAFLGIVGNLNMTARNYSCLTDHMSVGQLVDYVDKQISSADFTPIAERLCTHNVFVMQPPSPAVSFGLCRVSV